MINLFSQLDEKNLDNIVELEINGAKRKFEFLDMVLYRNEQYLVAVPVGENFVEIFLAKNIGSDDETFLPIASDQILCEVFEIFKQKNIDEFDFDE